MEIGVIINNSFFNICSALSHRETWVWNQGRKNIDNVFFYLFKFHSLPSYLRNEIILVKIFKV